MKPPSGPSLVTYLRICLVVFLSLAPFAAPLMLAQNPTPGTQANDEDSADDKVPSVIASAYINNDSGVWLDVGFDSGLEHKYDFPKIFSEIYGCNFRDADVSHNSQSRFTSINTFCEAPISILFSRGPAPSICSPSGRFRVQIPASLLVSICGFLTGRSPAAFPLVSPRKIRTKWRASIPSILSRLRPPQFTMSLDTNASTRCASLPFLDSYFSSLSP